MKTTNFVASTVAAIVLGVSSANAQDLGSYAENSYVQQVASQLSEQGYDIVSIETTFLGRIRIEARYGNSEREVVLNGRTGEVLRDRWSTEDGSVSGVDNLGDQGNDSEEEDDRDRDDDNDGGNEGGDTGGSAGEEGEGGSGGEEGEGGGSEEGDGGTGGEEGEGGGSEEGEGGGSAEGEGGSGGEEGDGGSEESGGGEEG